MIRNLVAISVTLFRCHHPACIEKGNKRSKCQIHYCYLRVLRISALVVESSFASLEGDADKHRDFTKHNRETVTTEFLTFAGKGEQRQSSFQVSLNEQDLCSPPGPSIIRHTNEHFG